MGSLVLPGELVEPTSSTTNPEDMHIVGYGIERHGDRLLATQPGIMRTQGKKQWISVQARRYIPEKGDLVLGVVTGKMGDYLKVDIGCADVATASFLAFEGATKRNRPAVKTGDLLYARVLTTSKHIEPELTCVDNEQRARGLGVIPSGVDSSFFAATFRAPLHLARRLISPKSALLKILGKEFKFEIIVGMNGRTYLRSNVYKELVFLRNAILRSEYKLESEIPEYVEAEARRFKGFDVPHAQPPPVPMDH